MTCVFRPSRRPALEVLEDRLAPGDALGWFSLATLPSYRPSDLTFAEGASVKGLGSVVAPGPGRSAGQADPAGLARPRSITEQSLAALARTEGSRVATVSPLVADLAF